MYLKRLDIQGFKSFADKISLEFNSGITAIVGPNGSGKSNISDAIRWVLGEQSVKSLRGSRMEDVIFAGTEHRKSLGFAEVSLTIDNSDGSLPVEFSEVTITRRVFRSGESEYYINRTSCRLKDIHELFLDTGIGKDGYSIIGQGRIDEILSTKSEDRRSIFEEASGIMKYKVRKQEAEKKLELTKQNLLRINDILNELEIQLEPLKQQSDTAKKYLSLRDNLKELEVNVYIENISKYKEKISELEAQLSSVKEEIDDESRRLENINTLNRQKSEALKLLDEKLESSRQKYYSLESSLEKYQAEIRLNEEKINHFTQNTHRLDGEISEILKKIDNLSGEYLSKQERLKYLNDRYNEYSAKLAECEEKMNSILASLDESERYIEGLKSSIMDKLDLLSDKKTQINSLKANMESLEKRRTNIAREVNQLLLEKDRNNIKKEELLESIHNAGENIKKLTNELDSLVLQKNDGDLKLAELRKKQNQLKTEIQVKTSRQKMLLDMERSFEGYNKSVRDILNACARFPEFGKGIHGALAQLIKVDKKYETAVEMALGSSLQNIVVTSEEDAKRAIDYLKKNKGGRATFLPISSVKGKYIDKHIIEELKKKDGFCGIASDLVSCDKQYRGIILSLLGRVVVVEDLDSAINIARVHSYGFRIVTLEGDILNTSGSITGGSVENRGISLLGRNREIESLKTEISKIKDDELMLEKQINETISYINAINERISSVEAELKDNQLIKARDENHCAQVEENIEKLAARIEMLNEESMQLARQRDDLNREAEKYIVEMQALENEIAETKKIVAEHQEKHKEEQAVRDNLHKDITNYKISVNSILESISGINEAFQKLDNEKQGLEKSLARKGAEKKRNYEEIEKLKKKNESIRNIIKSQEEEKTGKTLEIDRIIEERRVLDEELSETIDKINEINKRIMLLQEEFNRIELRKAKFESEMEAVQNRMWDEYELTYTNALEFKKDIGSISQAQKKIIEYRNEIKELGPVNVAAIDEYVKTKERYEFMTRQKNDMEQAAEKLQRIIYEMTSKMKKQFLEQFRLINENFNIVFRELFDGGRAQLILVDEENVLESGIEIEAQPPGKKLQNMMLLSGGERAFTAIALLFAILRLKPVPFCVLDEIEAALDDANVYRFAEYLKKYSEQTQFILVTHRKGTMECSDTLYGVTMQERGVSKIVSMKLVENKAM
ncbi:MAG TPA: chromosome segregation protein SMC [Clostridiaceae bacterium]|nr:chromosome segregation protein SMC [Clostridiaceae bacterium]